jgi:hypothetical protein
MKALGVRYLLEGSVRKAGDHVRINVHLIDSATGFQVWVDDFVGEMKDVFSLQEQTALKIGLSIVRQDLRQQLGAHRRTLSLLLLLSIDRLRPLGLVEKLGPLLVRRKLFVGRKHRL